MIKNLPTKKRPGYGGLTGKYFKKKTLVLFKLFQKQKKGKHPLSYYIRPELS